MLSYRDGVMIAILIIYVGLLPGAVMVSVQNGRNGGWKTTKSYRLLIFVLFRILTASFYLATINNPDNSSIWAGYVTCLGVAVSLLLACVNGQLQSLLEHTSVQPPSTKFSRVMTIVNLTLLVAFILGIVGGVDAMETWGSTGSYEPSTLSKVSISLFIAGWVFICGVLLYKRRQMCSYTVTGQRHWYGIVACAILLAPRIVWSAISAYRYPIAFSLLNGNTTILLCMALIEEIVVTVILEILPLTMPLIKSRFEEPSEEDMIKEEVMSK